MGEEKERGMLAEPMTKEKGIRDQNAQQRQSCLKASQEHLENIINTFYVMV